MIPAGRRDRGFFRLGIRRHAYSRYLSFDNNKEWLDV